MPHVRSQRCYHSSMITPIRTYKYADTTSSLYTPPLPNGRFNWLPSLWAIPDTFVLTHQSLDSYLFLRFLKLSVIACLVGCCITWPILFPVNATGGAGQVQLNVLTMSNVDSPWRFFAHAICAWLYFGGSPTILACAITNGI
jgi:calcium permeable stress-gated cation channel